MSSLKEGRLLAAAGAMSVLSAASNVQAQSFRVEFCPMPLPSIFCAAATKPSAAPISMAYGDPSPKISPAPAKPKKRVTIPLPQPDPRTAGRMVQAETQQSNAETLATDRGCIEAAKAHLSTQTDSSKEHFKTACAGSLFLKPFGDDARTIANMEGVQRFREGKGITVSERPVPEFADFNDRFGAMQAPATASWGMAYLKP